MRAYAKINLSLNNLGKVGSMHKLDMIISEIDLYDDIHIEKTDNHNISIIGMNIPLEKNLIYKAARKFLDYNNIETGLNIYIEKHIPEEAGLGGGSSDAACVLKLLNEMFETKNSISELEKLAFELGSDVVFFIHGGICRVSSFGEKVRKISNEKISSGFVIKPAYGLSTKEVFIESDKYPVEDKTHILDQIENHIKKGNVPYDLLFNDLELPADNLSKKVSNMTIVDYKKMLSENSKVKKVLMSGSGSSIFVLGDVEKIDLIDEIKNVKVYKF